MMDDKDYEILCLKIKLGEAMLHINNLQLAPLYARKQVEDAARAEVSAQAKVQATQETPNANNGD